MTEELMTQVSRIYERAQNETLALIQSRPPETIVVAVREWMSATQLGEYWQLCNDRNEPTTAGILKWAKRPPDQFPLPHAYMVISCDSTETRLICGQGKKARGEESKMKSGA